MSEYLFLSINRDGHVAAPPVSYDFPDDTAALKKAKDLLNGHDIEVRKGTRIIAYLVPTTCDDPRENQIG